VTAVSEAAKNSIHSVQPPAGRIEVIYNGIVPIPVAATKKNEVFTILAIGRLDRLKGFDILIDQMRDLTFDFRLLIIGEGPERDNLEERIHKTGMEGKVHLTGFREDIALLMKSSHVVVISSYSEGFSKVLAEAMFYADAVVSTPVGIAVEVLPAVFITEQGRLGEKIAQLYRNYEQFAREFKKISEGRRNDFLLPHIVEKYICYYREMSGK
jgi:glycosyltransferase involved in cell wall biosynthesis